MRPPLKLNVNQKECSHNYRSSGENNSKYTQKLATHTANAERAFHFSREKIKSQAGKTGPKVEPTAVVTA